MHAPAQHAVTHHTSKIGIKRVLLVENEGIPRMELAAILMRGGFEVVTANDGQQALELMQREELQLVLTDWDTPNLDGHGLCRAIRRTANSRYTYIIVLGAREDVGNVVRGLQSGADDYLAKPCAGPELLARLNTGVRLLE